MLMSELLSLDEIDRYPHGFFSFLVSLRFFFFFLLFQYTYYYYTPSVVPYLDAYLPSYRTV